MKPAAAGDGDRGLAWGNASRLVELHLGDEGDVAHYRIVRERIMGTALGPEESLYPIEEEIRP